MKLLFICKHNRFRSKVAEAIFNKLNKNPGIKAESAGIMIDEARPYIAENVIKIMREKGYSLDSGIPKRVTALDVNNYDLLVIAAHDVDEDFFNSSGFKGKIIKWDISDADEDEYQKIKKIIGRIEKKIKKLIEDFS